MPPPVARDDLAGAPFSFTNWGLPDLLLSDFPTSLEQLRDHTESVVVAHLLSAEIVARPDGVPVLPVDLGGLIPESELLAVHLVVEITEVVGGRTAPRTVRPEGTVDVYVGYDAGADYGRLFESTLESALSDGASYLLFLNSVFVGGGPETPTLRASYYTVDPSLHGVYVFDSRGALSSAEGTYVPWVLEPDAPADAVVIAMRDGIGDVRLPLRHGGPRVDHPDAADVLDALRIEPGTRTTDLTRWYDPRVEALAFPEGMQLAAVAGAGP